jgi:hypothetical protein
MLERFLEQLHVDVFDQAHDHELGGMRLTALTRVLLDRMEDAGILSDGQVSFYKSESANLNGEVHGYAYDSDEDVLSLFFCIDGNEDAPLATRLETKAVGKDLIDRAFRRLEGFVKLVRAGKTPGLEESQPAYELAELLRDPSSNGRALALHVLTTGTVSDKAAVFAEKDGLTRDVWDLLRLSRTCRGTGDDKLAIDFVADFGDTLPCLVTSKAADGIQVLFTCIPGATLAQIYATYRSRLLERNVRSFLQFAGKVNKGIRDTVLNAPSRFLPYNNGLSATTSSVVLEDVRGGMARIRSVEDFQIVNGGQTTASITTCSRRDGADLAHVSVAMKLTIVPKERVDELVPLISKYANTQNRIQEADFDANRPWHIELERLSRNTWTQLTQEAPRGTRWFYERSRGQYADELANQGTTAGRKKFRTENAPAQKFTKTDLAKFRLSWDQRPAVVSRGAQKCFAQFMTDIGRENRRDPDLVEFKRTVALAILFHTAEKLYGELKFTGYRANVVTYAVARLSQILQCRLPYDEIWESQQLPEELVNALKILIVGVREEIIERRPPNSNISEWSKKDQCWSKVLEREFKLDLPNATGWTGEAKPKEEPTSSEHVVIDAVKAVPAEVWFSIAKWAKDTKTLFPAQRSISFSIGQIVARGGAPTVKQARSAQKLINRARQLGFAHPALTGELLHKLNQDSPWRGVVSARAIL